MAYNLTSATQYYLQQYLNEVQQEASSAIPTPPVIQPIAIPQVVQNPPPAMLYDDLPKFETSSIDPSMQSCMSTSFNNFENVQSPLSAGIKTTNFTGKCSELFDSVMDIDSSDLNHMEKEYQVPFQMDTSDEELSETDFPDEPESNFNVDNDFTRYESSEWKSKYVDMSTTSGTNQFRSTAMWTVFDVSSYYQNQSYRESFQANNASIDCDLTAEEFQIDVKKDSNHIFSLDTSYDCKKGLRETPDKEINEFYVVQNSANWDEEVDKMLKTSTVSEKLFEPDLDYIEYKLADNEDFMNSLSIGNKEDTVDIKNCSYRSAEGFSPTNAEQIDEDDNLNIDEDIEQSFSSANGIRSSTPTPENMIISFRQEYLDEIQSVSAQDVVMHSQSQGNKICSPAIFNNSLDGDITA